MLSNLLNHKRKLKAYLRFRSKSLLSGLKMAAKGVLLLLVALPFMQGGWLNAFKLESIL